MASFYLNKSESNRRSCHSGDGHLEDALDFGSAAVGVDFAVFHGSGSRQGTVQIQVGPRQIRRSATGFLTAARPHHGVRLVGRFVLVDGIPFLIASRSTTLQLQK